MTAKQRLTLRISPGLWRLGLVSFPRREQHLSQYWRALAGCPGHLLCTPGTLILSGKPGKQDWRIPLSFSYLLALPAKPEGLTVQFLFRNLIAEEQGDGAISNPFCWDCL